ncbi:hypothetical protein A2U01_0033378 [Trifolium medium]|uniref:Uncharacterized protein n=1 Tax=Trifolium medium TaxID=97028 RepID=A0A392PN02_9FABA|nr:hypothetical protein [Trifolium medium]
MLAERLIGNGETPLWSWQWIDQLSASAKSNMWKNLRLLVGFSLQPSNPDRWRWVPGASGLFSVKSCYNVLLENRHVVDFGS